MWQQWTNALLGLLLIVVPFLDLASATLTWTLVVMGAIIAGLAVWGGAIEQSPEHHQRMLQHQ